MTQRDVDKRRRGSHAGSIDAPWSDGPLQPFDGDGGTARYLPCGERLSCLRRSGGDILAKAITGCTDRRSGAKGRASTETGTGYRTRGSAGYPSLLLFYGICLGFIFWLFSATSASAQTPSPLQEWQFSGGIILQKLFEPNLPEWRSVIGAAAALKPIYDGAKPYDIQPGPVFDIRYRDLAFLSAGEGLGINVLRGDDYRAGVALGFDLGRRVSQYPSHLQGLGNVSPAPAFKLFGAYVPSKSFPVVLRIDVRRIVGGADGITGDLSAFMPLPGSSKTIAMFAGPSLSFASGSYMQNVFGVNARQSALSDYRRFAAHGGLKSAGFGFSVTWFVTDHWLLNADTAVERLLGAAADSPITQEKLQGILALSAAYKW